MRPGPRSEPWLRSPTATTLFFHTPLVQLRSQAGVAFNTMSTTKPAIPVTNLKERIAALEQKNAANGQRSTSPNPGAGAATGQALRDRIAKFEKKGAVPAPRGRFGLGAPPPPEAQIKRNGELYGNRIPQPVRFASGESQPPSRSGSSIGFYNSSSPDFSELDKRRSFSLNSSALSDVDADDRPDYTPLTSPTFAHPPTSPESDYSRGASPTLSTTSDVSTAPFKEPIIKRAAPFSEILEAARKAAEKGGAPENLNDAVTPTPFVSPIARTATRSPEEDGGRAPVTSENGAAAVITQEPESIQEEAPRNPVPAALDPVPIAAPTIVVESPAHSPAPTAPAKPGALVQVENIVTATAPLTEASPATNEASPDGGKPKSRNNKDLTLELSSGSASETTDDNLTPTTANHLSPLPSGTSSVFSGSSGGSSLTSPRPFSMIDISLAERVTPATSRANVMFLPPTTATMPRKSDLVYFPPTPTKENPDPKASTPTEESSKPESSQTQPTTFNAAVREKVRETPEPIPHPNSLVPQTPSNRKSKPYEDKRWKRMTMMAPPTPVTGELASLIQNAVILETMVQQGELPTELQTREEEEAQRKQREEERLAAIAAEKARVAAEDAKRKAALEAEAAKRKAEQEAEGGASEEGVEGDDEFVTNKLRHTFLIPLSRARSQHQLHRKEASMSEVDAMSDKSSRKSPRLPRTPEIPPTDIPEVPALPKPSKSPSITSSKSRFSTFSRRLGSVKSVMGRPSLDVSVSEDGSVDNRSVDEFGNANGHEKDGSWVLLSPKKSGGHGRASTFAGMFSRSRKSSTQSVASTANSTHTQSYTLPPLPDSLSVIPPVPEYEASRAPRKSTSLKSLRGMKKAAPPEMNIPPVPRPSASIAEPVVVSPSDAGTSPGGPLKSPDYIGFGSMNIPTGSLEESGSLGVNGRPTSWMSVSSLASTLPSPLFEGDIFDAFPAVPGGTPAIPPQHTGAGAGNSFSSYGLAPVPTPNPVVTPSFDSAFLSSAIHLAGSKASGSTPKSKTVALPR